mmetsp:Transcript_80941/g.194119  ORF Transcript_80941/g.194119 Transcript_80941/m.194119 type:complete len:220 (-) Transcript_80941:746-1405(-)
MSGKPARSRSVLRGTGVASGSRTKLSLLPAARSAKSWGSITSWSSCLCGASPRILSSSASRSTSSTQTSLFGRLGGGAGAGGGKTGVSGREACAVPDPVGGASFIWKEWRESQRSDKNAAERAAAELPPVERLVSSRSRSIGGSMEKNPCSRTFLAMGRRRGFSRRISVRTAMARLEARGITDCSPAPDDDGTRNRQASASRVNSGQSDIGCPRTEKIL